MLMCCCYPLYHSSLFLFLFYSHSPIIIINIIISIITTPQSSLVSSDIGHPENELPFRVGVVTVAKYGPTNDVC